MSITRSNPQEILDFYEDSFAKYGNDPRSVHWSGEISQIARFEVLSNIASLNEKRILDAGCGLGDLYKFFLSKKIPIEYMGVDIVPNFVELARERFPNARFMLGDMTSPEEEFDYVLASGAFTIAADGIDKNYYFKLIKNMFARAKYGFAFNMLNNATHKTDETYLSYDIDEVMSYCKTLTENVTIITDYLPQDFTVYMYKK